MSEVTYENIHNLVGNVEIRGEQLQCNFKCPVSDFKIDASVAIRKDSGNIGRAAQENIKRTLFMQAGIAIRRIITSVLGHNVAGSIVGQVASTAVRNVKRGGSISVNETEKQNSIVSAFNTVKTNFVFDDSQGWVSKTSQAAN